MTFGLLLDLFLKRLFFSFFCEELNRSWMTGLRMVLKSLSLFLFFKFSSRGNFFLHIFFMALTMSKPDRLLNLAGSETVAEGNRKKNFSDIFYFFIVFVKLGRICFWYFLVDKSLVHSFFDCRYLEILRLYIYIDGSRAVIV